MGPQQNFTFLTFIIILKEEKIIKKYWQIIRRHVAEYIEQRDEMPSGYAGLNQICIQLVINMLPSDWKNIILCAGASEVGSNKFIFNNPTVNKLCLILTTMKAPSANHNDISNCWLSEHPWLLETDDWPVSRQKTRSDDSHSPGITFWLLRSTSCQTIYIYWWTLEILMTFKTWSFTNIT